MATDKNKTESISKLNIEEHFIRSRLNSLLTQAVEKALTIVCAGMGCGKTIAVHDFLKEYENPVVWVTLSKSDNISSRFWEIFVHAVAQMDKSLAEVYKNIGFPDTPQKIARYHSIRKYILKKTRYLVILDDFHFITNPSVLNFVEQAINYAPDNCSIVLISRTQPKINISPLKIKNRVCMINENDLNFTKSELNEFLYSQGLEAEINSLSDISITYELLKDGRKYV